MTQLQLCFYLLIYLILCSDRHVINAQGNSLTFSPSTPLCIGETVQMICYVVSPTAQQFIDDTARISFNNSAAATITNINTDTVAGIDTSRYTADLSGLTVTTDRPGIRLTITDYQASDGATVFRCHGLYTGGSPSPVLVSEYPPILAVPISLSDAIISFQILENLSIFVNATLSQIERNNNLNYTYTLDYNTSSETSSPTQDNSYTFMNKFTCDVCYRVSYTAENCAGGSGVVSSGYFGLQRVSNTTGNFTQSVSDPTQIEWKYNVLLCGDNTEENYLPDQYFGISLVNRETGEMSNITNSSFNLPHGFFGDIPQNINITTTDYDLEIKFIDPCFDVTFPINITFQFNVATSVENTLTIVLGIFFGLLLIILLVTIIVVCLVIFYCKKPPVKK